MSVAHSMISETLAGYHPRDAVEAEDLARVHQLIATADDPWSRATPLHVTASALIVHPESHRVLLRWHSRQRTWIQVGGHADPGETDPVAVALREAQEETGLGDLAPWPDASVVHVAVVPVPANHAEPAHEHADLRFVLATRKPDDVRPEKPDAELRWLTFTEATALTGEDNVRETLRRTQALLAR